MKAGIDCHVHMLGNGSSGSGCWIKIKSPVHKLIAGQMLKNLSLKKESLLGDFDEVYVERLLEYVRGSSLKACCILAHEETYLSNGSKLEGFQSFYVPNDYVLNLGDRYSEFLPVISIHPARRDAIDELDRCVNLGTCMLKCLPMCQNIDCNDSRYDKFWERMVEYKLPLLAHTGGELIVPIYNKKLSSPTVLKRPLEIGVNVIAAHCGTSSFPPQSHFGIFAELVSNHENLYGDNSGMLTPMRVKYLGKMRRPGLSSKVLYGSDFPIPVCPEWAFVWRLISWKDFRRLRGITNPLERDFQTKLCIGFKEDHSTRLLSLLRLTKQKRNYLMEGQ